MNHLIYVWLSYGFATIVFGALAAASFQQMRKLEKKKAIFHRELER